MRRAIRALALPTVFVGVLTMAFLLLGCSDSPLAPSGPQNGLDAIGYVESQLGSDPFATLDSVGNDPAALGKLIGTIYFDNDTVTVDDKGGTIDLLLGNAVSTLDFPHGAVTAPVVVTAVGLQVPTPWGDVTLYDFGPDGLVFQKAATLSLNTNLQEGQTLSLYWFDSAVGQWVLQETATVEEEGKVEFHVWHFSKYGIT